MQDTFESDVPAFVGVSFSNHVVYNMVETDGEFEYTGLSIINFLNNNKNKFVSDIILSQSYDGIELLLDDQMKFGNLYDTQNTNIDSFADVYSVMCEKDSVDYYYIYDAVEDLLFIKTPELRDPMAVDYKNSADVRNFRNLIRY